MFEAHVLQSMVKRRSRIKLSQEEVSRFLKAVEEAPDGAVILIPPGYQFAVMEYVDRGFENGDGI